MATLVLGICNPGAILCKNDWEGYSHDLFKRKYLRVMNIISSRFTEGDIKLALYFDGAVNYYDTLPSPPNDNPNYKIQVQPYLDRINHIESSLRAPVNTKYTKKINSCQSFMVRSVQINCIC